MGPPLIRRGPRPRVGGLRRLEKCGGIFVVVPLRMTCFHWSGGSMRYDFLLSSPQVSCHDALKKNTRHTSAMSAWSWTCFLSPLRKKKNVLADDDHCRMMQGVLKPREKKTCRREYISVAYTYGRCLPIRHLAYVSVACAIAAVFLDNTRHASGAGSAEHSSSVINARDAR